LRTLAKFIGAWSLALAWLVVAAQAAPAADRTILVLGDSLSAAYGLRPDQGWVALLQKRLRTQGYGYKVVNASVSGETTDGGLQRLPRALELHKPAVVILELGANDGLRGLPVTGTRRNLERMVALAKKAGARVVLVGMRMPPNYGPRYTAEFAAMYDQLATREKLPLVPFFLEEVALRQELMQADGLHPTAQAQPILLDTLWPALTPLLRRG
jgi:acyl-CoA thioesterase I